MTETSHFREFLFFFFWWHEISRVCFQERKLKRQGWSKPNAFHVCITSYNLVIQDSNAFRRKKWKVRWNIAFFCALRSAADLSPVLDSRRSTEHQELQVAALADPSQLQREAPPPPHRHSSPGTPLE
jgi:hypothetical protein